MKKYSPLLFLAAAAAVSLTFLNPASASAQSAGTTAIHKLPVEQVPLAGVVDFMTVHDEWAPFMKTVRTIHQPGLNQEKDDYLRAKAEANAQADALRAAGGAQASQKTAAGPGPSVGAGFLGNSHQNDPADNAMAISAGGKILSSVNSTINVYDSTGSLVNSKSLFSFAQGVNINTLTFDPKLVYDPVADRFVVVFLAGSNSSNSRVVVAFSQTNNPAGAYNIYVINGNVNNEGTWTDFPQIGLSTDELFITGNRFSNDMMSSPGASVWQINKTQGFAGASSITTATHVVDGEYSLHPVEGGLNLYGPHFYLIRTMSGAGNSVSVYRVTNTIANNGVLESPLSFQVGNGYSAPPEANQAGTSSLLKTNDARVQSSYFENNRIEYVHNTNVQGVPGILHGTIQISPFLLSFSAASSHLLSYPDYEISYPSIAYAGATGPGGENHSVIGVNYSATNFFPGNGALWVDETGYSDLTVLMTGLNPILGGQRRWGDYTDAQERPGHPGEVWFAGTFGNQSFVQRTWISQVFAPVAVANEPVINVAADLEVYPNPANNRIVFEFPVETEGEYEMVIRDMQGKVLQRLIKDYLRVGDARVAFNTDALPAGLYLISIENENLSLFSKQFAVQH
jgi:hypothetical protein